MRKTCSIAAPALALCLATSPVAAEGPPAFPGAEGFGAISLGGRDGEIVRVTSLADDGDGTLRAALEAEGGPRIVIFDVGGVIDLEDEIRVPGRVTVAGQTAPGGVTLRGARMVVVGDDVIIRGMRFRPGDGPGQAFEGRDGISVGVKGRTVSRVIVDRNSMTWAPDENAATWWSVSDITYSNNLIAEGLAGNRNSFGMLIGDGAERVSILGNYMAHNDHRNPQIKNSRNVELVGNVVFDHGPNGADLEGSTEVRVADNVFIHGPRTVDRAAIRGVDPTAGHILSGNHEIRRGEHSDRAAAAIIMHVLQTAGARPLDAIDSTILERLTLGRTITRRGAEARRVDAVTGVRSIERDCDMDGIPDRFERLIGSRSDLFDPHETPAGDGVSNLDLWLEVALSGPPFTLDFIPIDAPAPMRVAAAFDTFTLAVDGGATSAVAPVDGEAPAGSVIIEAATDGVVTANKVFDGPHGYYDLSLNLSAEGLGATDATLSVGDRQIGVWTFDGAKGRAYSAIRIAPGEVIELRLQLQEGANVVLERILLSPARC